MRLEKKMADGIKCNYDLVYNNCILLYIAHSISAFIRPMFAYEQSWNGCNYNYIMNLERGTISFDNEKKLFVGACRNELFRSIASRDDYDALMLFEEADSYIKKMACNETLNYLYDSIRGKNIPLATVAFWCEKDRLTMSSSIKEFEEMGGGYPLKLIKGRDELLQYILDEYEFSDNEVIILEQIYENYFLGNKIVEITSEINNLLTLPGKNEGIELLNDIGIKFIK